MHVAARIELAHLQLAVEELYMIIALKIMVMYGSPAVMSKTSTGPGFSPLQSQPQLTTYLQNLTGSFPQIRYIHISLLA